MFSPMKPNIIVWDLETVPDLAGFAAANDLVGNSSYANRFWSVALAKDHQRHGDDGKHNHQDLEVEGHREQLAPRLTDEQHQA